MMGLKQEEVLLLAKKWNVIYPAYIDSTLTEQEGRRIGKTHCVTKPNIHEISEILNYLKMPHLIESEKAYPRDILSVGRIKVMMKSENGIPSNPNIKKKKDLLKKLGELIPKLKSRVNQPQESQISEDAKATKKIKKKK